MRKWFTMALLTVICIACLAAASAETSFAITETSRNEWTLFKNTGVMSRYTYFNALFNATGLDASKVFTISEVQAPFEIEYYAPEYYGINTDGWQSDYEDHDFYGCVPFSIADDVLQTLECKDYTLTFTVHNGSTAKLNCVIHVVDAMPKTPTGIAGAEESYTIKPDETVTITPTLNPSGWAGTYETLTRLYVGKSSGSGYSVMLSDGTKALVTGDEGEHLVVYTSDGATRTITGKVPGYYRISVTILLPYANAYYDLNIPLTVLNPDGSAPINKPKISYSIDSDMSGDESGPYFHEITRYLTKLTMRLNCYMEDWDYTGILNELVDSMGAQAVTGKAVFTDANGKEYVYQITGDTPYAPSGVLLGWLSSGCAIDLDDLPAGDYQGKIQFNWYGTDLTENLILHRGYNPSGDPEGISGVETLSILRVGDSLTLSLAVTPKGWKAPLPVEWYSGVTSMKDWTDTSIYYEDGNWRISEGEYFSCQRTESASGVTDVYTAKASGFYTCSGSMSCADYHVSKIGHVMVLNADGSLPDGGLSEYIANTSATIIIPADTTKVESEAFANTPDNAIVYFPATVNEIAQDAFSGVNGLIILGARNSAAQRFAEQNGYSFIPVVNQ